MHSSTHLLHWHDKEVNWQPQAPDILPLGKNPSTLWTGCWMWPSGGHFGEEKNLVPAEIRNLDHPAGSLVTNLTTQQWHIIHPHSKGTVHISLPTCPKLLWKQFSTSKPLLHPHGTEQGCLHLQTMTGRCILRGGEMLSRNARKATAIQQSKN
jgi:hypothetical protein